MHEGLHRKLDRLIQEEQESRINEELLVKLREFASGETLYEQFPPETRNTLNKFFREVRDALFEEVLAGKYGPQVIIDAFIIVAFESGYQMAKERAEPSPS